MKVAKQAIKFYCLMTGNSWSDFYSKLDSAMVSTDTTGEMNLIRRLMGTIEKSGISINQLKQNKDAVKAEFDEDARKNAGEFFTPEIWCSEARKYFDTYIPNWHTDFNVWDGSCYSMDTQLYVKGADGKTKWITYDELKDTDMPYALDPKTGKTDFVPFVKRIKTKSKTVYSFRYYISCLADEYISHQITPLFTKRRIDVDITEEQYEKIRDLARDNDLDVEEFYSILNITPNFKESEIQGRQYEILPAVLTSYGTGTTRMASSDLCNIPISELDAEAREICEFDFANMNYEQFKMHNTVVYGYLEFLRCTGDHKVWVHECVGRDSTLIDALMGTARDYTNGGGVFVSTLNDSIYSEEYEANISARTTPSKLAEYLEDYDDDEDIDIEEEVSNPNTFWYYGYEFKKEATALSAEEFHDRINRGNIFAIDCTSVGGLHKKYHDIADYLLVADEGVLDFNSILPVDYISPVTALGDWGVFPCKPLYDGAEDTKEEFNKMVSVVDKSVAVKVELSESEEFWDITLAEYHDFAVRKGTCDLQIFCGNCGSGNLMRTAGHPADKLYLSSLQQDDIELIKNTPEYAGATAFQCDFLKDLDYDTINTDFLNKLPERLQQIIRNDEPLIIYMNPPYKSGSPKNTDVGTHMCQIGLSRPAYDIFYQFLWRVMHFVEMFNLSNTYVGVFGPLQFFTGASANVLLQQYERCFEFLDGMCLSAQEFSDTSDSIKWGIGFSLWKSRGGYINDDFRKDILLDKKCRTLDGSIVSVGKVLYEPPKEKLSTWVQAKDVSYFEDAPLMTSHLTFKDSEINVKVAKRSGSIATNALGTLMIGNTLTRSSDQSAVLSMPSTISYTSITEENFWRCVASYAFRRIYDASWAITKKEISAPNEKADGYDIWLRNALVLFLFEYKSMMSSIRGVSWGGYSDYSVMNKLFFCSADEVRAHCTDPTILEDIERNPTDNSFMLQMIKESEPYWSKEARALFDFCKEYTFFTLDRRKDFDYTCSLDCWDAGFQQLRSGIWSNETQDQFAELLMALRDYLRKDIDRFGFVTDAEALETDTPMGTAVDAGGNIIYDDNDVTDDESVESEEDDFDAVEDDFEDFDDSVEESEDGFEDFDSVEDDEVEEEVETDDGFEDFDEVEETSAESNGVSADTLSRNFTDIFASGSVVDTKEQKDTGKSLNIPESAEKPETMEFDVPAPPPAPPLV